jgi:hypothetical protein|tara:strand:- start:191 stop:493 length:303 start_codon:yes stop_codon:yes gene_type:complete
MPRVYIPNKASHDFSDAERFGDLVFLTTGSVQRYSISTMYMKLAEGLTDAEESDYVVVASLAVLNMLVGAIMGRKFKKINLLLFQDGRYLEKTVQIDSLL